MDNYTRLLQLKAQEDSDKTRQLLPLVKKPKTNMEVYNDLSLQDPELAAIAMIETSGGKNTNHALDPNSGMTAGGMFGMMPTSASDVVRLDPSIAEKYPEMVELAKDLKGNHPKITEFFNNNPEAAAEFAKSKYERNKKKLGGDLDATSYSWFQGLSKAMRDKKHNPDKVKTHAYTQKFKQYYRPTKITKID